MKILVSLAGLVLAGFLVDRLLLWMEWKGWIDYRRTYPGRIQPGQVGPAFLAIQGLLQPEEPTTVLGPPAIGNAGRSPAVTHAAEEQMALRTERDAEGEPPSPTRPGP